ncbi:uncharacterized protein LOC121738463 [Aricia agestis]|uniref:uncharacterized protein LOC121738463 n=1 Tax=Aricia agestis TaxID=91739 RepID=UPI001C203C5D|nr:uncharacterized protein LOC121738463 [Aricia agestis]
MGSNCCKGDAAGKPVVRSTSSIYSRRHAGATLDDRFSTSQDSRGVRLTISAATTDDSGVYTLQASNAAGTDTTRVRLQVSPEDMPSGDDPPTFLRRLHDLTVKVGTRTRFLVEIISSSECRVTWYRNERRLLEAERIALVRDGNFWCADIAAVSVDDAGRWTCTAENVGGRASCSAHLNVLVPKAYKRPEFVEELRALLTEQGTVSLECKVVGVPTPVLRWFKDSREIKAGDVFALTANAEDPTSLGTYTCEAVNCMGRAYSSSKVHVVGHASKESLKPSFGGAQEPPPIFTKELEDRLVRICERLNLGCHIVVPPWPRAVVWYNKEGKIEPSERYHVLEDGVGGYMIEVPSAEFCDEGEWKCVATSTGGRVGISTCYVSMEVPKNYRKPRFMENLQAILTEEGLVSFECKVVGFPTPVLSWFKDGQELKPGDVYQLTGTNSLGSYCCIARNCMGQASSSAELSVEDIQNQLNEEEKLQLFTRNQAPKFLQGLKSVEAKIDEPFRFTVKVAIPPEPSVLWYRDDQPVDETSRCHLGKEDHGVFFLDIQNLELLDQAEWKCVAMNDFGHSVTSCFLKLIIPRHYKKPRFLENLQAILSDEGAVNLECKVIGVPQPVLKWYKDGEELKPGDIHRIISGQDGTCCLGNYTCEARNCMGIAASSASLLGFEDSIKNSKKKAEEQTLQRNLSLSTIHEERTSQMYDTPVGDITLDDKGEISFSFDGKEVSVSLYETPDLTEEEALQIVEMYADQLSENVTEHNVVELPPLRFVKETSTSGNLLMEAIIIDVSPEYFITPDEDLRTEADIEDISIVDENVVPQLSLDPDISREDYLENTMALLSDEKADIPKKISRKKSDSQKSIDDYYSLSRDQSISESKKEDDTQPLSDSFASAHSLDKAKPKSLKPSTEEGQGSSDVTKTVLLKDELGASQKESTKVRRRTSSSRRSSSGSERSLGKSRDKIDDKNLETKTFESDEIMKRTNELKPLLSNISLSLTNVLNDVQLIEKDIIVRSQLMSSSSAASTSLEIINSIITPTNEILCIVDAMKETMSENTDNVTKLDDKLLLNTLPSALESLQQSLTVLEKCIEVESENKTLVQKTCISFVKKCGGQMTSSMELFQQLVANELIKVDEICVTKISIQSSKIKQAMCSAIETVEKKQVKIESKEGKVVDNVELKHLNETQKALHELRIPVNLLSYITENSLVSKSVDLYGVNYNEVILNNMSTSVQDLQNALEYVDNLALKESSTNLQKYNTEIIDRVMDSVLKLRTSFEQLSTITNKTEENNEIFEVLSEIKLNLSDISIHLDEMEERIGIFDVITNENKLEVLQKVAQVLISLENNLLLLEPIPEVQASMTVFHSNLTKVLENVIESNNVKKYFTLMEISAVVNRVNASLKNVDSDNKLCLIGIIDALKIIQANVTKNIFTQELNTMLISNIGDIIINIQKTINKAESTHLQDKVEHTDDMVTDQYTESKATVIIEHIEKAVAAINNIISLESTTDLIFKEALENVNPVLENLKFCIAASQLNKSESEKILQLPVSSEEPSIAKPLYDLQENISVLSQLISENVEKYSSCELKRSFAESLVELNSAIEILQQDVNSQAGDSIDIQEISSCLANVVQSIRSCILIIREHGEIEMTDDLSTLEDISGIKTIAESLPVDHLILPSTAENTLGQSVQTITSLPDPTKEIAEELLKLNDHIMIVHNPQIMEVLESLSEDDKYASLKSVMPSLKELHQSIEGNIPPVLLESCEDLSKTIDMQNLLNIVQPLQHLQQSLCVVDTSNIPISESVLQIPTDQLYMARSSLLELKNSLENCLSLLLPTISCTDETVDVSNKLHNLREKVKKILQIVENESIVPTGFSINVLFFKGVLENFLEMSNTSIDNAALKNSIEALYEALNKFEDEILGYASSDTFSLNEIDIIESLHEVEKNIAILEEHSFIDFSIAKDFESSLVPMKATALEVESLRQAENIKENIVHVIQDSINNLPKEDIESLERFFKNIKNRILLLNCLIQKHPTHKRIIRLIQDLFSLNKEIKEFENNLQDQALTDETNTCVSKFLSQSQEFLATIRLLLLNVVDTESNLIITIPLSNINSGIEWYSYILSSKEHVYIHELIKMLVSLSHLTLPLLSDLQSSIISEINTISECEFECDSEINRNLFQIKAHIMSRLQENQLDEVPNNIYHNLLILLEKHEAYKNSTNIGKKLIIIKFLSECYKIIHNICTPEEKQISILDLREKPLKEILFEMIKPLDDLHNELMNIQEQVIYHVDKDDSMSIDISSSESYVQALSEINEAIESHLKNKDLKINDEDMGLVKQIDDELHSIQSDLLSIEHVNTVENLLIPLTEIEKSFINILSIKTSEEGNNISNRGESKHDENVTVTVYAVDEDGKQPEKEESKVNEVIPEPEKSQEMKVLEDISAETIYDLEFSGFKSQDEKSCTEQSLVEQIDQFVDVVEQTEAGVVQLNTQLEESYHEEPKLGGIVVTETISEVEVSTIQLNVDQNTVKTLLHHVEQYVDVIEHSKEELVSLNIKLEDLQRSEHAAIELRNSLAITEVIATDLSSDTSVQHISPTQANFAQELKEALEAIQIQSLGKEEYLNIAEKENYVKVAKAIEQLQDDLTTITTTTEHKVIEDTETNKVSEEIKSLDKPEQEKETEAPSEESTGDQTVKAETVSKEEVVPSEQVNQEQSIVQTLLQYIEQYVDVIEHSKEELVPLNMQLEDLQRTEETATELSKSLAITEVIATDLPSDTSVQHISPFQAHLAQELKEALEAIQIQSLGKEEHLNTVEKENYMKVAKVIEQLQDDLATITTITEYRVIEDTESNKVSEEIKSLDKPQQEKEVEAVSEESTGDQTVKAETVSKEEVVPSEQLNQEQSIVQTLLQHIEQYVDVIDHSKEELIPLNIKLEDLQRTEQTATELRNSLAITEVVATDLPTDKSVLNISPTQAHFAQELKEALEAIQFQSLGKEEYLNTAEKENYMKVAKVIEQLQDDLATITTITEHKVIEDTEANKVSEEIKFLDKPEQEKKVEAVSEESTGDKTVKAEKVSKEQVVPSEQLNQEQSIVKTLLQHIEQYVEVIEHSKEELVPLNIKLGDLQRTENTATELRNSLAITEVIATDLPTDKSVLYISPTQAHLAEELKEALEAIQIQSLGKEEYLNTAEKENYMKVAKVIEQLQDDLATITTITEHKVIEDTETNKVSEEIKSLDKPEQEKEVEAVSEESTGDKTVQAETVSKEQVVPSAQLNQEQSIVQTLLQHIEQYVEVIEHSKEELVPLNIKLEDLQRTEPTATELRNSLAITEVIATDLPSDKYVQKISPTQAHLAQELKEALEAIQIQSLGKEEYLNTAEKENYVKVAKVIEQLQDDLATIITITEHKVIEDTETNKVSEEIKSLNKPEQEKEVEAVFEECTGDKTVQAETVSKEKVVPSEQQNQEQSIVQTLLQHIEQYVEVIEHAKEELVPLNIKLEDLQRTEHTATELRNSLTITEVIATDLPSDKSVQNISPTQAHLAQELKEALEAIQIQCLSKDTKEYLDTAEKENYMKIAKVIEQLQDNLATISTITEHKVIEDTNTNKVSEEIKSLNKPEQEKEAEVVFEEFCDQTVKAETVSKEQVVPSEVVNQEQSALQQEEKVVQIMLNEQETNLRKSDVTSDIGNVHEEPDQRPDATTVIKTEVTLSTKEEDKSRGILKPLNDEAVKISEIEVLGKQDEDDKSCTVQEIVKEKESQSLTVPEETAIQVTAAPIQPTSRKKEDDFTKELSESEVSACALNYSEVKRSEIEKNTFQALLQHIEQYVELTQSAEEMTLSNIKQDDLKEIEIIANELRESIAASEILTDCLEKEISIENITPKQAQLAHKLQIALETIHVQSISNEHELLLKDANQEPQVATVIEELRKDLTMISEITVIDDSLNNNTIQDLNSPNVTVVPDLQATRNEEETLEKYETTQEISQNIKELDTKTVTETEMADDVAVTSVSEPEAKDANIIKFLKEFVSDDNIKDVRKLSPTIFEELKRTSDIAKTMLNSIIDVQKTSTIEDKSIHSVEMLRKETKKLSHSINSLHGVIISEVEQNNNIKESDAMKKIVKSIIALKIEISSAPGDLDIEVRCEQEPLLYETGEQSLKKLEILLHEIKEQINTLPTEVSIERQDALNIILEEVQILIIKLKQDYDECKNDTLNETLEDLECSVRSVQLQLVENGPVDLLKEACLTLISLVSNIHETEATPAADVNIWIENVLRDCIKDIEETTILLNKLNPYKMHNELETVASNLKDIMDNIKSLKVLFSADVNVLIDKGVDIIQTFNQIEDTVFRLDKELESVQDIKSEIRESITSATHSIYMSLSNMRSSLNSIQKQYMYEHYGLPCEHFLRLLKQISVLTNIDDRPQWKILAKSLRQVLNHFEDIKFYINFDKTARLPNDAAFTKVILDNLQTTLYDLLFVSKFDLDLDIDKSLLSTLTFAEQTITNFEGKSVIEVREKIPIFCELSQNILLLSNSLNNIVKERVQHNKTLRIVKKVRDDKKDAPNIPISNDNKVENIVTKSVLASQEQEPETEIDKNIDQKLDIAEAKQPKSENDDSTFLKQEVGSSESTNVLKITDAEIDKDNIIEQIIAKNATDDQTHDDGITEHKMIHEPLSENKVESLPDDDLLSDKARSQDASKEQKQVLNEEQKESGHEATGENKGDESFVSKQVIVSGSQEEINVEKRREQSSSSKTPIRSEIRDIKEQQKQESPIEKPDTKNIDEEKVVDISIQKNKEKSGIMNDETQVEESEKLGSPQTVPEKVEVTAMNQEHEHLHGSQRAEETLCIVNEEVAESQETFAVLDRLMSDSEKEINQASEKELESDIVIEQNKIDSEIIDNLPQITHSDIQEQKPKKQEEKQLIVDTSYEGEKVSSKNTGDIKPSKSSKIEEVLVPPTNTDKVAKEINRDDDKNIESNTLDQNFAEIKPKRALENEEKYNNDDELLKSLPLKTPENLCIAISTLQPKGELDSSQSLLVQNVHILQHNEPIKQAPDDSPKGAFEEKIKIPDTIVPETARDDGNQKLLKENVIEKNKTDSPSKVTIENNEQKLHEQTKKATAEKQKEDSSKPKSVQDVQVDKRKETKEKNKNQEESFSEEASPNKSLTKGSSTESNKQSTTNIKQSESEINKVIENFDQQNQNESFSKKQLVNQELEFKHTKSDSKAGTEDSASNDPMIDDMNLKIEKQISNAGTEETNMIEENKESQVNNINKATGKISDTLNTKKYKQKKFASSVQNKNAQECNDELLNNTSERIDHKNSGYRDTTKLIIEDSSDNSLHKEKKRSNEKDRTTFIDYNLQDYSSDLLRPPSYIPKSSSSSYNDETLFNKTDKAPIIYKAQSLLQESQLRSTTPQPPLVSSEKLSRTRQRSKPLSECDSSISERRSGTSRDLKKRPSFSTFLTDRTAVEGSRVKLTCSVLSSSEPTVTWYKNGVALDNKQKYRSKYTDGLITLEVLNAVPTDSAEYKCTVANENGSITTSANLKVYPSFEASPIPPTFTRSIKDTYHLAENELVLECRIRGQPLPTITWLKDQVPIYSHDRYHPCYLADGVCRLVIDSPCPADSGIYTCKAENSMWSDQITHTVQFTGRESQTDMNITTLEKSRFHRQVLESRRPHFTNVLSDYKVSRGGTIGLQVEIRGSPTRVEWLREGRSVVDTYTNAQTYVDQETYTLALSDVTEKDSGLFTCRAWSSYGNVDMNASVTVVQPAEIEGKPAIIVSRPAKDIQISVGEDVNISFRVQGEPKPKVVIMKGIRDITNSQRVCKMVSDDYVKFTLKRSIITDAGTYCILARNAYGCDRAFVTVEVRQRASSDNLISDWTYPNEEATSSTVERNYKSVPDRIPGEPSVVDGGNNWVSLAWPKSDHEVKAPVLAYKVESWLLGKEGGARWTELGITPRNTFDAFNLKQGEEYHFRVTPRNRYGWGEPVQTSTAISIGLSGERPEFVEILPGQLKVLVGESAILSCSFKGKPTPEIVWMKNGHEIDEEPDRVKITPGGESSSLKIEDVRLEDEGRYSCEATNAHGRASTYARMTVITDKQVWAADAKLKRERSAGVEGDYPPQFTMRLRDRRVQATYPVRLTCQVIGSPPPTVTWFKNGELVIVDGRHSTSQDEFFYTLEIAPTNLDDGGVYEAMARNGCGAISCRCSLVVDKGIRAYVAPEFCCGLEPLYRLKEGEELRIAAMVEAYPSVGVAWYRDGVRLRPSRRAIMTLDRDGQIELAVASVTSRDAGVYSCTASNEVGSATTSGKVEVIEGVGGDKTRTPPVVISPDVPYSKEPMFIRKPRSSEAYEGDTVIIECEVIGDPKPDVYWLRDFLKPDYYRDAIHFKRVGGGPEYRLEIPHAKLDFTGAYSVVARNVHGEAKAIISLQILAKDPSSSDDAHNVRYGRVDVIPRFDKELTDLLCHDGDTVEFECHVSGNPEPDIRWFHYNEIIPDGTEFEATYEVGAARLRIRQVAAEDEGTYTCQATNTLGKATSSACLVVYPPGEPNTLSQRLRRPPALLSAASTPRSTPRTTPARSASRTPGPEARRLRSPARDTAPNFYTYPFNKVVEEGETVVFKCAVKGLPTPWATWDKDGIPLTPTARISIKEKDEMLRILEIEEVTIEDVGLYRITLENDYGRVEASARLEVITHRGKFYGSTRSYSPSPRRSLPFRRRTPSLSRYD